MSHAVQYKDVVAAADRMRGKVHTTQVLESIALNNLAGCRILVKAECLQKTGTFKIRGALNRVLKLSAKDKQKGVVAFSSGNFGQGLAAAAAAANVKCTIVMPGDAPTNKQDRARSYGATVVLSELIPSENREITAARLAEKLSKQHGFVLLHPFEDLDVIAGQGTTALELIDYCQSTLGVDVLDAFFVQAGGGGLTAGCCLALEARMPSCLRFAVEPEEYDDHARSFASGKIEAVKGNPVSICDALQAASPGKNTFPITKRLLTDVLTVSDDEVRYAMVVAFETLQIVLEPSGAVALAAVLANKVDTVGKTIAVIASGGNLNVQKFANVLGCPRLPDVLGQPPRGAFDWTGFKSENVKGSVGAILMIRHATDGAFLGCGYFNIAAANKLGEIVALVPGVSTFGDMLDAEVCECSSAATRIGITVGMKGRDMLEIVRKHRSKL